MSKKLLHKTLRSYILFSGIILIISAPVFYFATSKLFIEDADEALFLYKQEFLLNTLPKLSPEDVSQWNRFSRDIKIETNTSSLQRDSVFYKFYIDSLANENEPYRVLLTPVIISGVHYNLMIRINLIESEDLIKNIGTLFCLVILLLLAGLYIITRKLSLQLWLPFYSTLDKIEEFELNKNTLPDLEQTDVAEFVRLNQALGRLLERNITLYNDQKEFIENAAHELQTPLAVFQAKLDVLVQQVPFTSELGETLAHLNEAVAGLNRINKNLLLLSKIDNNQYPEVRQFSISDLLKRQTIFLEEQAIEKGVSVQLELEMPLSVLGNPTLGEIAISNLLLNALRHNRENGKIVIGLGERTLIIGNTGKYKAIEPHQLFQRFFQAGSTGGTGLGLAIVRKICDLHHWTVSYKFDDNMHFFEIRF